MTRAANLLRQRIAWQPALELGSAVGGQDAGLLREPAHQRFFHRLPLDPARLQQPQIDVEPGIGAPLKPVNGVTPFAERFTQECFRSFRQQAAGDS